jgi:iron complex transport system permease protein
MSDPVAFAKGYRRTRGRHHFWLYRPSVFWRVLATAILIVAGAALALTLGSYPTSLPGIWSWFTGGHGHETVPGFILGQLRLPRILLALLTGSMLGMAGAAMQSVTRNSLADPGLIGVKEGTVVAVLFTVLLLPQMASFWRPFIGLAGGASVAITVALLARSVSGIRFVLIGIGVSWLLSSAISLFMTMARISEVQTAMIWLGGSLHAASWLDIQLILPWAMAGATLLIATSRAVDAAMLGDMVAVSLGVRLRALSVLTLAAPVLVTAASASIVGGLGFVGLIAPHLARLIFGSSQLPLLVGSAIIGGALVLAADTLGRTAVAPVQIPAGIVLAMIGAPFFLVVLWRRRHEL